MSYVGPECGKCNRAVDLREYIEVEAKQFRFNNVIPMGTQVYHPLCFLEGEKATPECALCGKLVDEDVVEIHGRHGNMSYHRDCFLKDHDDQTTETSQEAEDEGNTSEIRAVEEEPKPPPEKPELKKKPFAQAIIKEGE